MSRLGIHALVALTCGSLIFAGWVLSSSGPAAINSAAANTVRSGPDNELKSNLVGSYTVTGTDVDGQPYATPGIVEISLAPSGAFEFNWDNGKVFGVGQVIGNALAVSCLNKGRTMILIMKINPDGSLAGNWLRRTERGHRGTEAWKRIL
jgi:hypothetical protein